MNWSYSKFAIAAAMALAVSLANGCNAAGPSSPTGRQGWLPEQWAQWYQATQGSRLLPLSWAMALEVPDSSDRFLSDSNLQRYNYLVERGANGLPVGFAVDRTDDQKSRESGCTSYPSLCDARFHLLPGTTGFAAQPWLGMNCAACHTNDVAYQGQTLRVDGAPTLADFQSFLEGMLTSLQRTNADGAKFDRFAHNVLGAGFNASSESELRTELRAVLDWQQRIHDKNATPLRYGFGRLDAQGYILNKVSLIVGVHDQIHDFPADAPASYPHIWDAPIEDQVQWNGLVKNNIVIPVRGFKTGLGALGRNVGEVIGVFASVNLRDADFFGGYHSTVQIQNLILMERQLSSLLPPKWPTFFPAIDKSRAALGAIIYRGGVDPATGRSYSDQTKGKCVACHELIDRSKPVTTIATHMQNLDQIGTDIWLACNTFRHTSEAGYLKGRETFPLSGVRIRDKSATADMLTNAVTGTMIGGKASIVSQLWSDLFAKTNKSLAVYAAPFVTYLPGVTDQTKIKEASDCIYASSHLPIDQTHLAYKARPLDGIWATAPYLHNGSVPTLYDLLLPAKIQNTAPKMAANEMPAGVPCDKFGPDRLCWRPESFSVGSHEFDPRLVGFVSTSNLPGTFEFNARLPDGSPILGNYNSGHNYGTHLSDAERWALIEYLKTL